MHRRTFLYQTSLLAATGILFHNKLFAANKFLADFNIRMLTNNIGIFTERGGTIGFVLGKESNVVIDAQFPDTAAHLIEEIKKKNPASFNLLLNTHHHSDHTAGNIAFKGIAEKVLAHENSLKNQRNAAEKNNQLDKQLFPDSVFSKDVELKIGEEKIDGFYYGPAHTDGDAIYHLKNANIMHVGDLVFNKRHPYIDRNAGANIKNWMVVLEKIINKGNAKTVYIFGHALNAGEETGTAEDLKKFQDYLSKVLRFAETEYNKGVTKEEFIKNTSIPGVTEWTGSGIERPLTAAYEEVEPRIKA